MRIGQLLLERGWIGRRQLAAALERQEQFGGTLGTCLLEMGAVSEELLMRALSEQFGVPAVGKAELAGLDEAVYGLLPAELAHRTKTVPFRLSGGRLDVAVLSTDDIAAQDQIAFVVGKRLALHVTHEARLYHAIETHYGKPMPARYKSLLQQLERPPTPRAAPVAAAAEPEPAAVKAPSARARRLTIPPAEVTSRSIPLSAEERAILEPKLAEIEQPDRESFEELERPGEMLDRLNHELLSAQAADDVARVVMRELSPYFVRTILLRVRRDELDGWDGRGPSLDGARLHDFHTSFNGASVLNEVATGEDGLFVGPLPDLAPHVELVSLWAGHLETECVIARIAIRDRPVGLLYADRGEAGIAGSDAGVVLQAATHVALALERCILRKRVRG